METKTDSTMTHENKDYIEALEEEIKKVKTDIEKKKASQDAAASFFK